MHHSRLYQVNDGTQCRAEEVLDQSQGLLASGSCCLGCLFYLFYVYIIFELVYSDSMEKDGFSLESPPYFVSD